MYSTKIQFAGAVDMTGKPLSRTTLGDPYVKGKREKNARFNGKQLGVKQCPKPAGSQIAIRVFRVNPNLNKELRTTKLNSSPQDDLW